MIVYKSLYNFKEILHTELQLYTIQIMKRQRILHDCLGQLAVVQQELHYTNSGRKVKQGNPIYYSHVNMDKDFIYG